MAIATVEATDPAATRVGGDVALAAVALTAPLLAAVLLSFASGGYFITGWGIAAILLGGVVLLVGLGQRTLTAGGRLGAVALAGWVGLAAWQGVSAWWADEPAASQAVMGRTLLYAAAFTLGMLGMRRAGWLPWAAAGALFAAWIPVAVALAARLLPGSVGEDTFARLTWPITYWNGLGALAAFGLVLGIGLAGSPRLDGNARVAAAACTPVFGLALYLTSSRGAILVAALTLGVLIAVGPDRLETIGATIVSVTGVGLLAAYAERQGNLVALGGHLPEHAAQGQRVAVATLVVTVVVTGATWAITAGVHRLAGGRRRAVGATLAVLACIALVGGWVTAGPGGNPVTWADAQVKSFQSFEVGARTDASAADRLAVAAGTGRWQNWQVAWDQWGEAPITGTGAGDYRFVWNRERTIPLQVVNAHSLYLEILGESGLVGLLLVLTPLAVTGLAVGMARRRGGAQARDLTVALCAAGVVAVHAAGDWDWQLPGVMLPAVVLGGAALGAATLHSGGARPTGWAVRAILVVSVVVGSLLVAGPTASAVLTARGRDQARAGGLEAALATARRAARVQPNAPEPRVLEANILADLGRPADADRVFGAALARSPQDWQIMAEWAGVLLRRGDRDAAALLIRRAGRLNPLEERVVVLRRVLARTR